MLQQNTKAPDFSLPDQEGKLHTLSAHKGKLIILYFYPKDNTPGCTKQACQFRDQLPQFTAHQAIIYGISKDSQNSHAKFIKQYNLNFTLLSDPDRVAHNIYQVLADTKTIRSTFLINEKGIITKIWSPVKVEDHAIDVLKTIQEMKHEV